MMAYAERTTVSSSKSIEDIRKVILRYGAERFAYGEGLVGASVGFVVQGRAVRISIDLPDRNDRAFTLTPTGKTRAATAAEAEYEQAIRQRWRALHLVVKAKLEAIEAGIATFEEEFYAYLVLPDGQTVYEQTRDQYAQAIDTGRPIRLMIEGG